MSNDIDINAVEKDGVSIFYLKGDVTAVTGEDIERAYHEISNVGSGKILFCFDNEGYINSGGIAILIGIVSEAKKKGQVIRFTGLTTHFQKIFNMVGLTKYVDIFATEQSALGGF